MLQAFESLDRDHRGYSTTNSIIAVLAVDGVHARPEERRVLLGGPAGVAGDAVAAAVAH